jgi:hypothetical protein
MLAVPALRDRTGRQRGGGLCANAADGFRGGRARIAAQKRDRLGTTDRTERRGGRTSEHVEQSRNLEAVLTATGASPEVTEAVVTDNQEARVAALDAAIALLAVFAVISLFFTGNIPSVQPGASKEEVEPGSG